MSDRDKAIAALAGGFAVTLIELAAQMSGYTNVPFAVSLVIVAVALISYSCWLWRKHVEPWHVIAVGVALAVVGLVWQQVRSPSAPARAEAVVFVPTQLRLQFFGDDRMPKEISNQNVETWYAYKSPAMEMSFQDADGKMKPGGFGVPPSWAIFVVMKKPTEYRQVIPTFSNPEVMPMTELRQSTQGSMMITARSDFPAGVFDIDVSP